MHIDELLILGKKVFKYCISGGTGALIDMGVYSFLISFFSVYYLIANVISFTSGTLATYYLQKNWTFTYHLEKNTVVFRRFLAAVLVTYVLNNFLLYVMIELLLIDVYISKIIQIILSTIWGYTINNCYVFNKKRKCDQIE